ncbi:MAG: hypothetical protein V2I76_01730 [Roseobacter sp.]|jgi:6,7-dimethyl-8-ribityllumazine synthase|nr:hypothetical protein [Roseobacter sp.]
MTKPDRFQKSHLAIVRGRFQASASEQMFDAAQKAIEETRQLLEDVTLRSLTSKGQPE